MLAAPHSGFVKVNWDASINKQVGCYGMGIIVRDSAGAFLGAKCLHLKGLVEPHVAEIRAALEAVFFAKK
jgi:hypothetical protein